VVRGSEDVPWPSVIAALVIARLCEPSSELHIAEHWFRTTALDDLLGIPEERMNDDRLYRALDVLLPHKTAVEQHIRRRLGELFDVSYDILLYDITSTYFEGAAEGNALAQRGYSRDHRPDCKQVNIALVTTKEGLPLACEVFSGNTTDVTTVKTIITQIEAKFGQAERVWIMDRGMVSADVLAWLRQAGRQYVVGTPKSELKRYAAQLLDARDWIEVREGLEVKPLPAPEGTTETFVLCRSAARKEKERAMRARFAARIEAGLRKLQHRVAHAQRPIERGGVERQVGRLLSQNSRAARCFAVRVTANAECPVGLAVSWQRVPETDEWAELSDGCYLLRASQSALTPDELWQAYMQLTQVEEAFRVHKTALDLRPVYHQTADRVRAHILVCFLAYVLWKTLEQWSQRAGLGRSPRKLLDEFAQIRSADVVLPTTDGRALQLRCVTTPERPLSLLLDRLGLELPKRLRPPRCLVGQL
jgi:transposase